MDKLSNFFSNIYIKFRYPSLLIGKNTHISPKSTFGGNNAIDSFTMFYGELGYGSYIGSGCFITGSIGKYCSIGNEVVCINGNHPSSVFVSTSPLFYRKKSKKWKTFVDEDMFKDHKWTDTEKEYSISVGNDVWIGSYVRILDGITIGNGAIIAAGAVVTKDVAPYSIVGGVPARTIRMRFSDETIDILQDSQWWDWDIEFLKKNVEIFHDIEKFVAYRHKTEKHRME